MVKERNGRFLKRSNESIGGGGGGVTASNELEKSYWEEVSDDSAREKIAHGFRSKIQRSSSVNTDESSLSQNMADTKDTKRQRLS